MTLQELNDYRNACALLAHRRQQVEELERGASLPRAAAWEWEPSATGTHSDHTGMAAASVIDAQAEIRAAYLALMAERVKVEAWIATLPLRVRVIAELRFVQALTWMEVADRIGGRETEYSVKHALYRYLAGSGSASG